jgi:hypothetical protein
MPSWTLPFAGGWSAARIIQPYGPTKVPNEPVIAGVGHFHFGIDFGAPEGSADYGMPVGTPILAMHDGQVTTAGRDPYGDKFPSADGIGGFGNLVVVDHLDGTGAYYGHHSQVLVNRGDMVRQGQVIGLSGMSGNSGGVPHLHAQANRGVGYSPTNITPLLKGTAAGAVEGPPAPVASAGPISYSDAVYYARQAGIPEGRLATCVAIAMAESSLDPRNINAKNNDRSVDRGLWMINSSHIPPYNATALFDPAYNARAMADLSSHGASWSAWVTYWTPNPKLSYRQYLDAATKAVAATPLGYTPTYSAGATNGGSAGSATDPTAPAVPADTTPQLPAIRVEVTPVTPRLDLFASVANTFEVAKAWIAGSGHDGGHYLDPIALAFSVSEYETPAVLTDLTLAMADVPQTLRDALRERAFTQVILYGGFVTALPAIVDQTLPLWTGVVGQPQRDFDAGEYKLSGADYSEVFSNPNATASDLSQFANSTGAQIVEAFVAGHQKKGAPGLSVVTDASTITGQALGADTIKTRQTATTEWDVMQSLAQGDSKTLYCEGTTLYYRDLPPEGHPLYLTYKVDGEPASLLVNPVIADQPHAKRDVRVEVKAYDPRTGDPVGPAIAGNHDGATVKRDVLAPGSSLDACQKRANWLATLFAATEYTLTCQIQGVVPLARGQAIVIVSDDPDMREYAGQKWYPSKRTYKYSAAGGWTMSIDATSLPLTVTAKNTSTSGVGNLGF